MSITSIFHEVVHSKYERPLGFNSFLWHLILPFYCIGAIIKLVIDGFVRRPFQDFLRYMTTVLAVVRRPIQDFDRYMTTNELAVDGAEEIAEKGSDEIRRPYNLRKVAARNRLRTRLNVKDKSTQSSESLFGCGGCNHIHSHDDWSHGLPRVLYCFKYHKSQMLFCPCTDCQQPETVDKRGENLKK